MDTGEAVTPVERVSEPSEMPAWVRHEHEARYRWAGTLVDGKRVLDVACGTGYGAPWLIEGGAESVHGFDVSAEGIAEAQAKRAHERVRFEVGDGTNLPVDDDSFDMYLSFETIEHIQDDAAYVAEAARVLRPGGRFICSTPNRNVTNPGTSIKDKPYNPWHVREYTREDLHALLTPYFNVGFIGQTPRWRPYVAALGALGQRAPMAAVRAHQARKVLGLPLENQARHQPTLWPRKGEAEVIIAMCTLR